MKKIITALLSASLILLQCTPLSVFADLIEVAPGNMVFLDVTDAAGNSVEGVTVTLSDSTGTEIGGIINDDSFFVSNASGIDGTELGDTRYCYYVPWSTFTPYVAPQTLHSIRMCNSNWDTEAYQIYENEPVYINGGIPYKIQLYSYDASQATALTVPANQFAVYVDPKWANRTAGAYLETPSMTRYINFAPLDNLLADAFTLKPGTTSLIEAFDPNYYAEIGLNFTDGASSGVSASEITVSSAATEYVLCRMPLYQLCPYFITDGNFEKDGLLYDLRLDSTCTSSLLTIQSGAVINAVIPDQNGYVEFYLDRTTRDYSLDFCYHFSDVPTDDGNYISGGSGFSYYGTAANITEHFLEALQPPTDEIVLTFVPAGTYTLTYTNLPKGYTAPDTTTITVTNTKELQYFNLVLKDAVLLGDVNADKLVNAADAAIVLSAAAAVGSGNSSGLTAVQETAADVNADGIFNALDASLILQYAAYVGTGGTMSLEEFLNTAL